MTKIKIDTVEKNRARQTEIKMFPNIELGVVKIFEQTCDVVFDD